MPNLQSRRDDLSLARRFQRREGGEKIVASRQRRLIQASLTRRNGLSVG